MIRPDQSKDDRIAALIDNSLKQVYSDITQEELPDRFKDLLAVLKAQDSAAGGNTDPEAGK